jgi:multidrug efflux system outer membrane protein
MVAVRTYRAEYEARAAQMASAQNAAELSWVRYEGGLTSYLEVLDLQRSLFSSQLRASETRQLELTSVVRLYAALGGGWVAAQDTMGVFGETMTGE